MENEEYQLELWTRGAEDVMYCEMFEVLEPVICQEVRDKVKVRLEDEESEEEEDEEEEEGEEAKE